MKCTDKELANIIFSELNPAFAKLGRVCTFIPVNNYEGCNFIEETISDKLVAYVEHDVSIINNNKIEFN